MTTREYPNHRKFKTGLQRIIAESVAETLDETDQEIAAAWRIALRDKLGSRVSSADAGAAGTRPTDGNSTHEPS